MERTGSEDEKACAGREQLDPASAPPRRSPGPTSVGETERLVRDLASSVLRSGVEASGDVLALGEPSKPARGPQGDARYRALVEQLPAVVFMAHLAEGVSEAYVSPHIEKVLGFSRKEWLEDPVLWYRQIHPEDKERWNVEAARMLVSGEPLRSVYRVLGRDGRVVWLQCEAKMVRAPDGRPTMIHGIAVDVTELKETQAELEAARREAVLRAIELEEINQALQAEIREREEAQARLGESEERFRLLVEGAIDYAIYMLDREGRVVSWNTGAERIHGYRAAEIIGQHFSRLFPAEDVEGGKPELALAIADREGRFEAEGWRVRKDGSRYWANAIISALRDTAGRLRGFVKITRDVTERKRLEEKLKETERLAAMGATAAAFAHEIGNPLNAISTSLQLLRQQLVARKEGGGNEVASALHDIINEIQRLGGLLQEFRLLARPRRLDLEPVSIPELVGELVALEAPLYRALGVTVEQDFPADWPPVVADRQKLKQVLLNLFKNAVEAMPGGGTIAVKGRVRDDRIVLEVRDTGIGIPGGFDIFELFKTSKPGGTGLGLAIVRQIVSAHGGTVSYQSEPGNGTTFTIVLPLKERDSEP